MARVVQVSVVIPVFNRASIVGRAIVSVIRQSYPDWEVVVVDDASEDTLELGKVVDGFNDPRLRIVRHDFNQGGAVARNTGVRVARGRYIAFLDSDDEWAPTKLECQMAQMAQMAQSGAGNWLVFCQSWVHTVQKDKPCVSLMPSRSLEKGERMSNYLFVGRGWLQTSSMFLSRDLALRVPFNPALRRHQDYDILLRLEDEGCGFAMIPEPLVVVHWEDLHQSCRGLNPANSLRFLEAYRRFFSPPAQSGFVFAQIVMRLLAAGRRLEAVRHLLRQVRPWHLKPVQHVSLLSALIFRDTRIARLLADLKRRTFRSVATIVML